MNPVWTDSERMSGTPCFTGTRVPVETLFDLLCRGRSIGDFFDGFPTVRREQVLAVLEMAKAAVIPPAQRPKPLAATAAGAS